MPTLNLDHDRLRQYYFFLEALLGFGILVILNATFWPDQPAFLGVHPHPYWTVILLIASRYGTLQGLLGGGLAAALFIYFTASAGKADFAGVHFPHGPYTLPFLFMLVGGLLGEIRNVYKKRYLKLEDKYYESLEELQDLGLQFAAVSESKQELEKRIAFQSTTLLTLFERLNNIETLDPEKLYERVPELLQELINASCASVYLVHNNRLVLFRRSGETEKPVLPDRVELTDGMMGEVIRSKRAVSVNRVFSEADLSKFQKLNVIMAAPILRQDGTVVGVINVEDLPFFDYNANTLKIFEMLCYWISLVVDKAIQFQELKDRNIADEITGAYNYLYFQKRLEYEIARAKRFKTPLSLLLLEVEQYDLMKPAEKKNVLVVLNWIFSHLLREVDIIAKFKIENSFAIILPGQGHDETETILKRLMSDVDNYRLKPFEDRDDYLTLKAGTSTLQLTEGSYDSLVKTAEERLRHGGLREEAEIYADIQYLANLAAASPTPAAHKNGPEPSLPEPPQP